MLELKESIGVLLEVSRALRFQSGLPLKYRGECLLTTTYLINKLPTSMLHIKSPHEILFHIKHAYDCLRVFGCLVYAITYSSDKFAPRAIKGVFIGYPRGKKGYKIFNLSNSKIFVSRNIIFHETVFPYLTKIEKCSSSDPHDILP